MFTSLVAKLLARGLVAKRQIVKLFYSSGIWYFSLLNFCFLDPVVVLRSKNQTVRKSQYRLSSAISGGFLSKSYDDVRVDSDSKLGKNAVCKLLARKDINKALQILRVFEEKWKLMWFFKKGLFCLFVFFLLSKNAVF